MLTAEFNQTEYDLREFQKHHVRHSSQRWRTLVPVTILCGAGLLAAVSAAVLGRLLGGDIALIIGFPALLSFVCAATLFSYSWFLLPALATWRVLTSPEQKRMLIGSRTFAVSEGGIAYSYPAGESSVSWDGVNRIEVGAKAVYFYFNSNVAVWVPMHAFGSSEQFDAFAQTAREWFSAWKRGGAVPV